MGFGTGHHATTRLCLAALQTCRAGGSRGARCRHRIRRARDCRAPARRGASGRHRQRPDAIQSARDNLGAEPGCDARRVRRSPICPRSPLPPADVVTANLTGALLIRSAPLLLEAVRDGGTLILSGILAHERDAVREAFADATVFDESHEDEWVGRRVPRRAGARARADSAGLGLAVRAISCSRSVSRQSLSATEIELANQPLPALVPAQPSPDTIQPRGASSGLIQHGSRPFYHRPASGPGVRPRCRSGQACPRHAGAARRTRSARRRAGSPAGSSRPTTAGRSSARACSSARRSCPAAGAC